MNRSKLALAAALALTVGWLVSTDADAGNDSWLHVVVQEAGEEAVKLNLPLGLATMAANMMGDDDIQVHLDENLPSGMGLPEIRLLWAELKRAGDAEIVQFNKGEETVDIRREGGELLVQVAETGGGLVDLQVPVALIDALLGGEGDRVDLRAGFAYLSEAGAGDILRVRDGLTNIRAWVDSKGSQ